ncbi:MAG: histidine kinase [Bacteroidota bacterium]|nr:histidine kinase [Bacteroidota bacterium]
MPYRHFFINFITIKNYGKYFLAFALITFGFTNCLFSQERVFKQFTTKDGLPSNQVYFVLSDSKGYVWMCTDAGIAKYNANNFKVFSTVNGMPDNTVFEAKEDHLGRVWFRTLANKIGYIFNDSVFNIGANSLINSFVLEGKIISFNIDKDGLLLIGKQSSSICSFLKILPPYRSSDAEVVKSKIKNVCGTDVLVLKNKSVVFTEARNSSFGAYYKINIFNDSLNLIQTDSVLHINTHPISHFCLVNNNLFYSSKHSLIKYNLRKKAKQVIKEPFMMISLTVYRDSILLVGTFNNGVYQYNTDNFGVASDNFLNNKSVTFITEDFQNGIWISTLESGVYYYGSGDMVKYKLFIENGNSIASLINVGKNNLWLGLNNGAVCELNFSDNQKMAYRIVHGKNKNELKNSDGLNSLIPITKNKILVSTRHSNLIYNKNGNKESFVISNFHKSVKCGIKYGDKLIICGISDVYLADTILSEITHLGSISDRLSAIAVNGKDVLVAGLKGLYKYNSKKNSFEGDIRFNTRIEDIGVNSGTIYLATKANGLFIVRGNKIDTVSEKQGLISNICNSVLLKENQIWVVTNRGISKITDFKNGKYNVINYSLDYFVDPVDVKNLCLIDDFLFFHSDNFIYSFNTKARELHEKCLITEVVANGKSKNLQSKIVLKYNSSDIKIAFEALFYNLKGKINYRYNYGRGWVYTGEPSANLVALSHGTYTFQVEALNLNNDWVKSNNNIIIQVEKPFWQTAGFIILLIVITTLVLSGILFALNRRQLLQEKKKNQINIKMIELESKALRSLMNPHFIFNSLNALLKLILESDLENAEKYLIKFSKLMRKLLESGAIDKILLEDELDILNKYLEIEKLRFDNSFEFKIESEIENAQNIYIPFMLIQPFVENAIWHGLASKNGSKHLNVRFLQFDENRLMCVIDDDGVGRTMDLPSNNPLKSKSLALDIIRQRLELITKSAGINCFFKIIDKEDDELNSLGTRVEVLIPILK